MKKKIKSNELKKYYIPGVTNSLTDCIELKFLDDFRLELWEKTK